MKSTLHWALAAALGVGGMALCGCERDNNGAPQVNTDGSGSTGDQNIKNKDDASRTAGSQLPGDQIGAMDLNNIYSTLGDTVEAAATKGGFDDMVERFAEADRTRIGDFKDQKFEDLDGRIDAFRTDWKAKYNSDFEIDDKVFENWATISKTGETSDVTKVTASIPASHGLPALKIPLVKDNLAWKIDLPESASGDQLKSQVLTHLTKADESKAQWPDNVLEAKRAVTHQVLAGVMGAK